MDPDILARAVKAGLVLGRCPGEHFQNGLGEWCCDRYSTDDGYLRCARCDGTGQDRTPWAIFGAVVAAEPHIFLDSERVGVAGASDDGDPLDAEHSGTPESVRDAAVLVFCRAREARDA